MFTRTEVAVFAAFGGPADAHAAIAELTANAFAGDHIHLTTNPASTLSEHSAWPYENTTDQQRNVSDWIESGLRELSDSHEKRFFEAAVTVPVVVAIRTTSQMADKAAEILNRHRPLGLATASSNEPEETLGHRWSVDFSGAASTGRPLALID
jgi:hypothetical protein